MNYRKNPENVKDVFDAAIDYWNQILKFVQPVSYISLPIIAGVLKYAASVFENSVETMGEPGLTDSVFEMLDKAVIETVMTVLPDISPKESDEN